MKPRQKVLCELCVRSISSANISRHKWSLHSYCQVCKLLVSRKRHRCFKSGAVPLNSPPTAPKDDDQYLLVYVPVLIRKQLCKKLQADGSVWPLYNIEGNDDLAEKVKDTLKKDCFTCCVSEFLDVPDDRHPCTNPNREEFVTALQQCTEDISDQRITDVYRSIFGGSPNGLVL